MDTDSSHDIHMKVAQQYTGSKNLNALFWDKPKVFDNFCFCFKDASGSGHQSKIRPFKRNNDLDYGDLKNICDLPVNQVTWNYKFRIYIALKEGSPNYVNGKLQDPAEVEESSDGSTSDSSDSDMNTRDEAQPKGDEAEKGKKSLFNPSPSADPKEQFHLTSFAEYNFSQLYNMRAPENQGLSWWPLKPSTSFKGAITIALQVFAQLQKFNKQPSLEQLTSILPECHEDGDFFPALAFLADTAESPEVLLCSLENTKLFHVFQLGPCGLHPIMETTFELWKTLKAHGNLLHTDDYNCTVLAVNSLSIAIRNLLEESKRRMHTDLYALKGFAEFFKELHLPIGLYKLPKAMMEEEYLISQVHPTRLPDAARPVSYFADLLRKDFGSDGTKGTIPDTLLRLGLIVEFAEDMGHLV
ncbi:hypothetical protein V5O48_012201 [Marasmius crinis-equi]|uniref:Uncharacterized protein n=1 Tax=Marasmius crinis-equi TaxID=585013 RepID=A0ABR3F3G7_9AGAR